MSYGISDREKKYGFEPFLKWLLFNTVVLVGVVSCFMFGFFGELWDKDVTKLSFLILAMYFSMSIWCGVKTFVLSDLLSERFIDKAKLKKISDKEESGWFVSDLMTSIGMIGTVIGFIMMLGSLNSIDTSNMQSVKDMFNTLGKGMAIALLTTLVGLICSSLLKVQYFNLSRGIEENTEKEGR